MPLKYTLPALRTIFFSTLAALILSGQALALNNGDLAPDFSFKSQTGKDLTLKELRGKIVVLEWFNKGCPFVKKHYQSGHMQSLQREYGKKGVEWITINSTAANHSDYLTPEETAAYKTEQRVSSTMVIDGESKIAALYGAKTTPHVFIIDAAGKVVYQGAIDDNPDVSGAPAKAKNYLRTALDEILSDKAVSTAETRPYGCSVKYAS